MLCCKLALYKVLRVVCCACEIGSRVLVCSLTFCSHHMQVDGTCFMSGTKAGEPVADGILAVASKLDVDILVMGISGYG